MDNNKILIICGSTGTGKTTLALNLAKKFNGEILSADSRMVYKGMDVVTGKDLPKDGSKIWLTDLADPKEEFSVAAWRENAQLVLEILEKQGKLPIVVGGTGLYIKSLTGNIETLGVPQNQQLREQLKKKAPQELFEILAQFDSLKVASMNESDKNNPRRLIRAIEISDYRLQSTDYSPEREAVDSRRWTVDYLRIGLIAPSEMLDEKIDKRVAERVANGALDEVTALLAKGVSWSDQAMTAIGYAQLKNYFLKTRSLEECIKRWEIAERQYARRQMTWFKKDHEIIWFDVTKQDWLQEVEILVQNWYN